MRLFWVHGSGYTQDSFRAQAAAFPESDALSLPGHPSGEPLSSIGEMADWVCNEIRRSGQGPAIVGGNSLGGAIALDLALRHRGDVGGLILIGTGARLRVSQAIFDMLDNDWPESIASFVDFAVSPHASGELRERVRAWHQTVGKRATRMDYVACNQFDVMGRLAEIRAPALIVVGGEDRLTPPKFSRYLHEQLAGSELLEVPGAGHIVMAERPDVVNPAIERFAARIAGATREL
ncbi:MAG: alpha/beta hydrolase [Candidatus Eremiobacteraeota bacterium]|nr:alpha/beta hydrolase [Candidatus Eremiobacteraeota bacterium]MBV8366625.1 alpha/beta hydrolase [Candidatus Eremiobacteraeota bacterium]